jgi:hypothetical protein
MHREDTRGRRLDRGVGPETPSPWSFASAPRWDRSQRSSWHWTSGYALVLCSRDRGPRRREASVGDELVECGDPTAPSNVGSGGVVPEHVATKLVPADQEVFHDPEYPSSVILTVLG